LTVAAGRRRRQTPLVAIVAGGALCIGNAAPGPFAAARYVDEAIAIVRDNALFADRVDWPVLSMRLHAEADAAKSPFEAYPALVTLVRALGDHHSFVQLPAERAAAYPAAMGTAFAAPPDATRPRAPDRAFLGRRDITGQDAIVTGARVRTVVVPANADNDPAALRAYAARLHRAVVTGPAPCGYVVDLRGNSGGNMTPMVAGLGVLLGDGAVGGFVAREGVERWIVRGSRYYVRSPAGREQLALRVPGWRPLPAGAYAPVAVLIDGGTASSGEVTAIAAIGRDRLRVFGGHSFGISTATSGYRLSDGVNLVLVDSQVEDRTGKRYPDGIVPDGETPEAQAEAMAAAWVARQCPRPAATRRLTPADHGHAA